MATRYVLKGRTPVEEQDPEAWALWYENNDREIARDELGGGDILIRTMFLGHPKGADLFETTIRGGPLDGDATTWRTVAAAVTGHAERVAAVRLALRDAWRTGA